MAVKAQDADDMFRFDPLLDILYPNIINGNSVDSCEEYRRSSSDCVLVTGGAGYIGSHTIVELIDWGYQVVVVDNLSNSSKASIHRVEQMTGKRVHFHQVDLLNYKALHAVFSTYRFRAVLHFAGLKSVGESVLNPMHYYRNNLTGTLNLLDCMRKHRVWQLIFSSSATVYGQPEQLPLQENASVKAANPYGRTKLHVEEILQDMAAADGRWRIAVLRYFNPVGAHPSGLIGEDPCGTPANLMPFVFQVAVGKRSHVNVYGDDYPTKDGTGVRDYIHVVDVAKGHIAALRKLSVSPKHGCRPYNLGTGVGYSVFDMIAAAERASGRSIPYVVGPRRPGDVGEVYADPSVAATELGWKAEKGLEEMCADQWRWQCKNPHGYQGSVAVKLTGGVN